MHCDRSVKVVLAAKVLPCRMMKSVTRAEHSLALKGMSIIYSLAENILALKGLFIVYSLTEHILALKGLFIVYSLTEHILALK